MITVHENGSASVFGLGTIEVCIGKNDQMDDKPYILMSEWSEPQDTGLYNEDLSVVTGEATGKKVYLQFMNKESFEVFDEAVSKIRNMFNEG